MKKSSAKQIASILGRNILNSYFFNDPSGARTDGEMLMENPVVSHDWSGYRELVVETVFSEEVSRLLPAALNRFLEAQFFLEQLMSLPVELATVDHANWYMSAHVAAVIGIEAAAKMDFSRAGRAGEFRETALKREFWLRSDDPDPLQRDPLAVNRAYWDLRHLRVHCGRWLLELRTRVLKKDIYEAGGFPASGKPRWYLQLIAPDELRLLRRQNITREEANRLNESWDTRPAVSFAAQHLYMMSRAIIEKAHICSA